MSHSACVRNDSEIRRKDRSKERKARFEIWKHAEAQEAHLVLRVLAAEDDRQGVLPIPHDDNLGIIAFGEFLRRLDALPPIFILTFF